MLAQGSLYIRTFGSIHSHNTEWYLISSQEGYWINTGRNRTGRWISSCFRVCVDHNKLWEILQEMGIPDHLICLLRNLYAGQEATVRTGHGTDWFQIGKGVHQGCILSPCLFNLYAEYIMRNAGLQETQAGIKIAGRNINNFRSLVGCSPWSR